MENELNELLDCGHPLDAGVPYGPSNMLGWRFVRDGERRICHACADARTLDCGHHPSPHEPFTTGYGTDPDTGRTACYACCAEHERARMLETGRATLYLLEPQGGPAEVTDWPGMLRFAVMHRRSSRHGGGFGSARTDAWFRGPDGYVWHAVNRGDNQIARCRRTKTRAAD